MKFIIRIILFTFFLSSSFFSYACDYERDIYSKIHSKSTSLVDLKKLIQSGVSIETKSTWGRTPLHVAVIEEQYDKVRFLIKEGANVNTRDKFSRSILDTAVQLNNIRMVRLIVKYMNKEQISSTIAYGKKRKKILESNDRRTQGAYYFSDGINLRDPCYSLRFIEEKDRKKEEEEDKKREKEQVDKDRKLLNEVLIFLEQALSQKISSELKKSSIKSNDAKGDKPLKEKQ